MKQLRNNVWRFIDKHPWIGGMPLLLSVVTLIGFCVYAWYQCALPGDLEGDMFNFLNMGFVCLFWAVKISLAGSLVLSAVFLFLGQNVAVVEGASNFTYNFCSILDYRHSDDHIDLRRPSS